MNPADIAFPVLGLLVVLDCTLAGVLIVDLIWIAALVRAQRRVRGDR